MGTQKTVYVQIAPADLQTLKDGQYNLCFAKKVGSTFNVVWQSLDGQQYLPTNEIYWVPQYQLFGTNTFSSGVTVLESTNPADIMLGQQATLASDGEMGDAISGPYPLSLNFVNNFGPIHPGVSQIVGGGGNGQAPAPIFVAQDPIVAGSDQLTPVDQVMVWFDAQLQTSTMFSDARSNTVVADLTEVDTVYLLYSGGAWVQTTALRQDLIGEQLPPVLSLVFGVVGAVSAGLVATKITSYLTGIYTKFKVDVSVPKGELHVSFEEKSGHRSGLRDAPGTRDELLAIAGKALSALGVQFTKLSAT